MTDKDPTEEADSQTLHLPKDPDGKGSGNGSEFAESIPVDTGSADLDAPEIVPERNDPEGTADAIVGGVDIACGFHSYPLTLQEKAGLKEDLIPVLRKYDVPDLPIGPELRLAATTLSIVVPRIQAKREEAADDSFGSGQEGDGQERSDPQDNVSTVGESSEASDLLS